MPFTVIYNCELEHGQNHYIKCHFLWFFASSNIFFSSSLVTKWKNILFPGYTDQNGPLKPKFSIIFLFEFHCRRSTLCIIMSVSSGAWLSCAPHSLAFPDHGSLLPCFFGRLQLKKTRKKGFKLETLAVIHVRGCVTSESWRSDKVIICKTKQKSSMKGCVMLVCMKLRERSELITRKEEEVLQGSFAKSLFCFASE